MAATREAVAAEAANDVALAVDQIAGRKPDDVGADGFDGADEFVADDHGWLDGFFRPRVPVVNVNIGPADGSFFDLDEDVVDAGLGHGDFREREAGAGLEFGDGAHSGSGHEIFDWPKFSEGRGRETMVNARP